MEPNTSSFNANSFGFEVSCISVDVDCNEVRQEKGSGCNYFELIWVTKGSGYYWIDFEKFRIDNLEILCKRPNQISRFEELENLQGYIIRIKDQFLMGMSQPLHTPHPAELLQLFSSSKGIHITEKICRQLNDIIRQLNDALESDDVSTKELLEHYFEILLIHLRRQWVGQIDTRIKTRNSTLVEDFMSLLEKNYREIRMVSDYASLLFVTPNYLNEIIKKVTGHSAGYQIRQRVGLEAKRQALNTRMCMKEIAYYLGFSDQAHFSKFFKSTTGKNFTDFRKERVTISHFTATEQNRYSSQSMLSSS